MSDETQTTEEYWGSTIHIAATPQSDGGWQATATIRSLDTQTETAPALRVRDQPGAKEATAAARSLAASTIDSQRVSHGKP